MDGYGYIFGFYSDFKHNYGYYIFGQVITRRAQPNKYNYKKRKKKKKNPNSYPPHPHFSLLSHFVFLRLSLAQTIPHRLTPTHRTTSPSLSLSNLNRSHTVDPLSLRQTISHHNLTPPFFSTSTMSRSDNGGQDLIVYSSFQFHEVKILCFPMDFFFWCFVVNL